MHQRDLAAIRAHFARMPFAVDLGAEVVAAAGGAATVTLPLSTRVAWNEDAFAGAFVGLVADLAAGAAALGLLPVDRAPMTMAVDFTLTGPTTGSLLRAEATLAASHGNALAFSAVVRAEGARASVACGAALVTLRAVEAPRGS